MLEERNPNPVTDNYKQYRQYECLAACYTDKPDK